MSLGNSTPSGDDNKSSYQRDTSTLKDLDTGNVTIMKAEEVGRTEGKRVNANDDDDYVLLRTIGEHVKKSRRGNGGFN
jgi:hypothetical protein